MTGPEGIIHDDGESMSVVVAVVTTCWCLQGVGQNNIKDRLVLPLVLAHVLNNKRTILEENEVPFYSLIISSLKSITIEMERKKTCIFESAMLSWELPHRHYCSRCKTRWVGVLVTAVLADSTLPQPYYVSVRKGVEEVPLHISFTCNCMQAFKMDFLHLLASRHSHIHRERKRRNNMYSVVPFL